MKRLALAIVATFMLATCMLALPAQAAERPEPDVQDILFLGPTRPVLVRLRITIDGRPFRESFQARFDEAFAAEDRDADGRLDLEQATNVVGEMAVGPGEAPTSELKAALREGVIAKAALAEYVERTLPPFVLRPRSVIGQSGALALFPLLDANRDGRLSAAELAAAERRLVERDFDDNGTITRFELILDPKAIAAAADPNAGESNLDPNETPVLVIAASTAPDEVARRLLSRYDRDGDGRLAIERAPVEIRLPPAVLGQWDDDADALLSQSELAAAVEWTPDLELSFAMGEAPVHGQRTRRAAPAREGFRARRKLLGGYELDLAEAHIDFDRNNRDPAQDRVELRDYDRDNNQYVDLTEARAAQIAEGAFQAMDIDGDGKVFKGELTSFMARQNEAGGARLHLIVRDLGRDLFDRLDLDADGVLSPRDMREAPKLLEVDDANADRQLGPDEVPWQLEFELARGVDRQTAGEVRRAVVRPTTEAEATGPLWFRKMDRNNDGDLSIQEFVGPRAAFDRLDTDGDELVSRGEAEAAEQPR
jgi:Ca2+-binding EF-hand superfamily protein